jgi:hypothetical protein
MASVVSTAQQPARPRLPPPPASPGKAETRAGRQRATASRRPASPATVQRQEILQDSNPASEVRAPEAPLSIEPQRPIEQAAPVAGDSRTYSPEILKLLQSVYGPAQAKIIVEGKAKKQGNLVPEDVLLVTLCKLKIE